MNKLNKISEFLFKGGFLMVWFKFFLLGNLLSLIIALTCLDITFLNFKFILLTLILNLYTSISAPLFKKLNHDEFQNRG